MHILLQPNRRRKPYHACTCSRTVSAVDLLCVLPAINRPIMLPIWFTYHLRSLGSFFHATAMPPVNIPGVNVHKLPIRQVTEKELRSLLASNPTDNCQAEAHGQPLPLLKLRRSSSQACTAFSRACSADSGESSFG